MIYMIIKKLIASIMGCMILLSLTSVCAEDKRVLSNEEIVNIASGYVRYDISDGYVDFILR